MTGKKAMLQNFVKLMSITEPWANEVGDCRFHDASDHMKGQNLQKGEENSNSESMAVFSAKFRTEKVYIIFLWDALVLHKMFLKPPKVAKNESAEIKRQSSSFTSRKLTSEDHYSLNFRDNRILSSVLSSSESVLSERMKT